MSLESARQKRNRRRKRRAGREARRARHIIEHGLPCDTAEPEEDVGPDYIAFAHPSMLADIRNMK